MKPFICSLFLLVLLATSNSPADPAAVKTITENIGIAIDSVAVQDASLLVKYRIANLSDQAYKLNAESLERPILVFQGYVENKGYIKTWGARGSTRQRPTESVLLKSGENIEQTFKAQLSLYPFLVEGSESSDLTLQLKFIDLISSLDEGNVISITLISKPFTNLPRVAAD